MTRIHAEIVLSAGAVLLVLLWVLWRTNAPARAQDSGRVLLAIMVVQGIIGYTQFFTHLPAILVGIHVFGASMVWATALWFHHGLSDHRPNRSEHLTPRPAADRPPAPPSRTRRRAGAGMTPAAGPTGRPSFARQVEVLPVEEQRTDLDEDQDTDRPWLVIVWNDPINLMSFVTFVFQKLFGYSKEKATKLMLDVHHKGRAVVSSGTRERAELDVYRLHEHGLWATMEQST